MHLKKLSTTRPPLKKAKELTNITKKNKVAPEIRYSLSRKLAVYTPHRNLKPLHYGGET
jgi:hypothetical protein